MPPLYKKLLISLLFLAGIISYSAFAGNSPTISWNPEKVETEVFPGGIREIEVSFTSNVDLENIEFNIAPPLKPLISIEPSSLSSVNAGEEIKINIVVAPDTDTSLRKFSGVVQIRGAEKENVLLSSLYSFLNKPQKARIIARSLLVNFEVISAQPALDLFEEFLIEEFGTIAPEVQTIGDLTEPVPLPEDIIEAFTEGTEGAFVLEVGSIKLLGPLSSNNQAEEGLANLLIELDVLGVNTTDLEIALANHDLYIEGTKEASGLLLTPGDDAVFFFPRSGVQVFTTTSYDEDGDGFADYHVVVIDNDTHVIHRRDHMESIINNDFFNSEGALNPASTTMLHELLHAMIFRTDCFEGTVAHEEDFASEFENIVSLRIQESSAYNSLFADFKENYPEGKECLDRLGLDFISSGESPWPQFQHDSRHTGQSEFQGPQTNNIKWRYPNAQAISVSTPVVGPNNVVYFGMKDENSIDRLIALNPDGSLRFKTTELNSPISSPAVITNGIVMIVTGAGSQIVAFEDKQAPNEEQSPLWSESVDSNISNMVLSPDGTLYFVTPALFLHSYTPTHEGIAENWSRVLAEGTSARGIPTLGVGESGNIYLLRTVGFVPPRTRIYIINPEDGSNARPAITVSGQPPASSLLVLEDDTLVLGLPGLLRAIDPVTGTGTSVFVPSGINTVPILLPDGNIAIGVKEGPVFPLSASGNAVVHKIDLNLDNEDPPVILHTIQLGTAIGLGSPVVDSDGTIYITKREESTLNPDSSTLYAINSNNTIKFTKDATRFPGSLALGSNETLYSAVIEFTNTLVANLWAVGDDAQQPILFLHGIKQSANDIRDRIRFNNLLTNLDTEFGRITPFVYYGDIAVNGTPSCPFGEICDSQTALADNAEKLRGDVQTLFNDSGGQKITLMGYSMGSAIMRGYIAQYPAEASQFVNNVFFLEGAQQGSYLLPIARGLVGGSGLLAETVSSSQNPVFRKIAGIVAEEIAKQTIETRFDVNLDRPAATDLAPRSDWYHFVNSEPVNPQINYYNFFGDIKLNAEAQIYIWNIRVGGTKGSISLGDYTLLPGEPDPSALPFFGGARFVTQTNPPNESVEWAMPEDINFSLSLDLVRSLGFGLSSLTPGFSGTIFGSKVQHTEFHNFTADILTDGDISVTDRIVNAIHSNLE